MILRDPRILILDAPTSIRCPSSTSRPRCGRCCTAGTSIVIAHRLSTILAADQILVLDHGRLVDAGTHTELLSRGGLSATLYERQFRSQHADTGRHTGVEPVLASA